MFNFCFLRRIQVCSILFSWVSHSVMSEYLWQHGLQHARLPCPSPTPRAYSNSCPLSRYASRWCPLSQRLLFFEIPYNWDHILLFFLWLSLLSVMPSSFIHEVIYLFFQWLSNIYLYMSHHIVLIPSPIERYSGCSYIKATMNNAAINMGIQISLWENDFISFDYISRSGIMYHITVLF